MPIYDESQIEHREFESQWEAECFVAREGVDVVDFAWQFKTPEEAAADRSSGFEIWFVRKAS